MPKEEGEERKIWRALRRVERIEQGDGEHISKAFPVLIRLECRDSRG